MILAESRSDAAVLDVLARAVSRRALVVPEDAQPLAPKGWNSMVSALPAVCFSAFTRGDIDVLIIAGDGDGKPFHLGTDVPCDRGDLCRYCALHLAARRVSERIFQTQRRVPTTKVVVALAQPSLEAWLSVGTNSHFTEQQLRQLQPSAVVPAKQRLKVELYGSDRLSESDLTIRKLEHARRIANQIASVSLAHPVGFGSFERDMRLL